MIRIGLVDLDTSHPHAFTMILRTMPGVEVTALWDGGEVWPEGYDRHFAEEHQIPRVCTRLEEMPGLVDAAMIHGCNWDRHIEKALHFMKAGKPVLIDKPVVGSLGDCERLLNLQAKYGTIIYGGSSLRFAREVQALRDAAGPRERLLSAVASGPGDFFSYGIHTTEMLQGLVGGGIVSVRWVAEKKVPLLALTYRDGMTALLFLEMPYHQWALGASSDEGMKWCTVSTENLYEPFLENFIALIKGEKVDYTLEGPLEAVRVHCGARLSRERGREVTLRDLPLDVGFDGAAFAREYAETKRPAGGRR
jgi:predicted dehydrogenase